MMHIHIPAHTLHQHRERIQFPARPASSYLCESLPAHRTMCTLQGTSTARCTVTAITQCCSRTDRAADHDMLKSNHTGGGTIHETGRRMASNLNHLVV